MEHSSYRGIFSRYWKAILLTLFIVHRTAATNDSIFNKANTIQDRAANPANLHPIVHRNAGNNDGQRDIETADAIISWNKMSFDVTGSSRWRNDRNELSVDKLDLLLRWRHATMITVPRIKLIYNANRLCANIFLGVRSGRLRNASNRTSSILLSPRQLLFWIMKNNFFLSFASSIRVDKQLGNSDF